MTGDAHPARNHPAPEQRFRLYLDESGDHVLKALEKEHHRYLCLLGCWFRGDAYANFHAGLEAFKQKHIPHSPDDPVILHREDIVNCRGSFWRLRDEGARGAFDRDLVELISQTDFSLVAIVIDKAELRAKYPSPSHPYHLALGFMLQRYCGYLNHVNRHGDVMAESRGKKEDRLLSDSYEWVHTHGAWRWSASVFQQALTSRHLKIKPKSANIAGLQLSDILAHPVRSLVLSRYGRRAPTFPAFAEKVLTAVEGKFNRQLYQGTVEGYGYVLFPE